MPVVGNPRLIREAVDRRRRIRQLNRRPERWLTALGVGIKLVEVAISPSEGYLDGCMKLFKGGLPGQDSIRVILGFSILRSFTFKR